MNHSIGRFVLFAILPAVLSGCYRASPAKEEKCDVSPDSSDLPSDDSAPLDTDSRTDETGDTAFDTDTDTDTVGDSETNDTIVQLLGPPMVYSPTFNSFRVNAVVSTGDRGNLTFFYRPLGEEKWSHLLDRALPSDDIVEWMPTNLTPDTTYEYVIAENKPPHEGGDLFTGRAVTQRYNKDEPFSFMLLTDAHIAPLDYTESTQDYAAVTLTQIGKDMLDEGELPDFALHLGDQLDFHVFGFNDPPPDGSYTKKGYMNYRGFVDDAMGLFAHFNVVGNWDGETGCFTTDEINRSREQRVLYMPAPNRSTYPQGGSDFEDYYAFTWADALFVVLNVMTYTPTCHALSNDPGLPDDWTLGKDQYDWLATTLSQSTSKWKFLFIHHTVGGAAGDSTNSAYGRGGGQAAYVGEQAGVHELMLQNNVQIFFYGHDHVFMDMVVDGIHYTLPGGAGAPWMFESSITGYPTGEFYQSSGHARVDVNSATVHVTFLGLENTELYSFTVYP